MTLQQIFNLVSKRTFFSRDDDEVWAAISSASRTLFLEVEEENRGFFIVFDTTSLALLLNQEEYALPQGCSQIIRLRERLSANAQWAVMLPADDLSAPDFVAAQFPDFAGSIDGTTSQFEYYGPYLKNSDAQTAAKVQSIRVEPPPQDVSRFTELVYIAKFIEITNANSPKVLPDETDDAVIFGASVICLSGNAGVEEQLQSNSGLYTEAKRQALKWVRARQKQRVRQVETYINDLD